MDNNSTGVTNGSGNGNGRIDLTRATEAHFWCRVFDLSMDELRDAVHHAGHQVDEVQRYLRQKQGKPH